MVAHAKPRQLSLFTETSFGPLGGPADWSSNGSYFYAIDPETSGVAQQTVENENNQLRARGAQHQAIRTLRNGNLTFGLYLHSKGTNAAEAAAATTFHVAELLFAALGGRDLGWSAGVVSSGAEDPDEVEIGADPGFSQGDWLFIKQTSTGIGEFYRILSIAAGPPITLTLDRDLAFTPDVGGADTIHAVIDCFVDGTVTTDHASASHKTMSFLAQGQDVDDLVIAKGCKPSVTIESIEPGAPARLSFDVLVTTFETAEDRVKEDFGNATPLGEAGIVPGIGETTTFKMATFGDPLVDVDTRGSYSCGVGVAYDRVTSPAGWEGVVGHVDTLDVSTLEIMVPFDAANLADFRASEYKTALIQIGNTATSSVGIFYPKLSFASEPARSDEGGLTTHSLSFVAHEDSASPGALTGTNLEKWRSPLHILIVA